ncbi:hypothetical protein [Limnoglobus roseus]|uniref:DUF4350 domain-containing protein n=1 Tax=Limnoglobus roseus TaxID=2598579 RepID=A0A5C1A9V3_9BACT|nr:hypothetical protein [Limnoglobus roseus]QEL13904.1 hypothetical protein PX52LOC_00762 [Limnoglobus roseus]
MRAAAFGILAALVFFAPRADAQGIRANDTDILRGLLKYQGFTPQAELRHVVPNTLVVVVGTTNLPQQTIAVIRDTVLPQGGALLILPDRPGGLGRFFPNIAGATVSVASVRCDDPANCFGGNADAPLAQVRVGDPTGIAAFNVGMPVTLATNRPHALDLGDGVLNTEVARFPAGSRFANQVADGRRFLLPLAVRSDPDLPYTALVYADRAMFSNGLMTAATPDGKRTSNFVYTFLLTKFLTEQLHGRGPKMCYFVEDGQAVTDFDRVSFVDQPNPPPGGIPPGGIPPGALPKIPLPLLMDKALDVANDFVMKVEERDFPNVLQQNDPRNRIQENWLYVVAIIGSAVLLRYVLARGWSLRQTPDQVPRLRIDPDRGGGLIPERRLALLQSGNLFEPLRDHLRFVFTQWGVTAPDPDRMPKIETDRKTRPRGRIVADLERLWEIAFAPRRTTITPDDLEELEDMIADLAHAHTNSIWRFAAGGTA